MTCEVGKELFTASAADDSDNESVGKAVKKPNWLIFKRLRRTSYGLTNRGRALVFGRVGAGVGVAGGCSASARLTSAVLSARQRKTAKNDFLPVMLLIVGVDTNIAYVDLKIFYFRPCRLAPVMLDQ
jgi:hypothetical protein